MFIDHLERHLTIVLQSHPSKYKFPSSPGGIPLLDQRERLSLLLWAEPQSKSGFMVLYLLNLTFGEPSFHRRFGGCFFFAEMILFSYLAFLFSQYNEH